MSHTMALAASTARSLNIFGQPQVIFGVPVERDIIFTNHRGIYKKWIEKRQRKLIVKTTFVKFFLQSIPRVLLVHYRFFPASYEQLVQKY